MLTLFLDIPFPYKQFTEMEFFLTDSNGLFIPQIYYTRIDEYRIKIDNAEALGLDRGSEIRFTFCHNKGTYAVNKHEYNFKTVANKRDYQITSPYNDIMDLDMRIKVFYDRKFLYPTNNYKFNPYNGLLILDEDFVFQGNKDLSLLCFYAGTKYNHAIPTIPMSGYLYFKKHEIDRNYNKDLFAVFVNGKLIPRNIITDMSNNIHKINKDIETRYNIEVMNMSPKIDCLVPFYKNASHINSIPKQYKYQEFSCMITVPTPDTIMNRYRLDGLLNPITFEDVLPDHPECYITLLHHGISESGKNFRYDLKFFRDDYSPTSEAINVIGQVRQPGNDEDYVEDSPTALLLGTIPDVLHEQYEDYPLMTVKAEAILKADTTYNNREIDGVLCRMEIEKPKKDKPRYVYYELNSTDYEKDNCVNIFEWIISEKPNGQGEVYYRKTVNLFPYNDPYEDS